MKKLIIFILVISLIGVGYYYFSDSDFLNKKDEFKLTGQIIQSENYCGGAPPQKSYPVSSPASNKTIHIKKGEVNNLDEDPVETVTTDKNGSFSVNLPAGTYCVVEEQKESLPYAEEYAPNSMYRVDTKCLEYKWNECDKVVEVSSSTTIKLTYNKKCFWEKECTLCKQEYAPCPLPQ